MMPESSDTDLPLDPHSLHVLSLNENPFPPLADVRRALEFAIGNVNRYPDPTCLGLVSELSRHHCVPEDDIVVGADTLQIALQLVRAASFEPGTQIMYPTPSFEAYDIISRMAHVPPIRVPLTRESAHDLPGMAAALGPAVKIVLLSNPHNLTGVPINDVDLRKFINALPADTIVVLDEAFQEFVRDPAAANGIDIYRDYQQVVVLRSFSNAHGLADLRVGYAVAHSPIIDMLHEQIPPFTISALGQAAAVASLRSFSKVEERVESLIRERKRLWSALTEYGFRPPRSEASFIWLPPEDRCFDFALRCHQEGIAVRLYSNGGLRISIGTPAANSSLIRVAQLLHDESSAS
ncbi:putative phenylalanine aminotransferase [Actinomadura sp. RB68]|uniref:Putative phenylalanine aminotransferase n=1 Tax=Actinomadura macrotermitis TaxID=2585200 RepID=A0A7K0BV66_9ACTN|nr:putative phenylalanine aminotransferase [Actinomadura macrotermitis]